VYEVDFLGFSYGFRPGRNSHHALDAFAASIVRKKVSWVLDADIRDFFTKLDQGWLERFLEHRIADRRVLGLIRKWLSTGVIENGEWSQAVEGTPQGASVLPLLANVYLHYVFGPYRDRPERRRRCDTTAGLGKPKPRCAGHGYRGHIQVSGRVGEDTGAKKS
jgi:RNA-directed DNA polymerase